MLNILLIYLAFSVITLTAQTNQAPTLPPPGIIYSQPVGGVFILRLENRRYEIPNQFKETCAQLIQQAQHSNLKMAFSRFVRAIDEKKKSESTADVAKYNLQKSNNNKEQLEQQLSSLSGAYWVQGDQQFVTDSVNQIETQKQNLAVRIGTAKNDVARKSISQEKADSTANVASESYNKAEADYNKALETFEASMNDLRTLATSRGRLL